MHKNLKGFRLILVACLSLTAMFALADMPLATASMPPHSFLQSPVANTAELVSQVSANPKVMDHYQRHFGMRESEVLEFLKTLHVGRLEETKMYNVYLVREDGMIDLRPQNLKAGTKVFEDASGKPILVLACGNPMIPPKAPTIDMVNKPVGDDKGLASLNPGSSPSQPLDLEAHLAPEPSVSPLPQIAQITPVVGTSTQPLAAIAGPVSLLAFLPLIGGHGGSKPSHTPVPEPASMIALGLGGSLLVARRRKK